MWEVVKQNMKRQNLMEVKPGTELREKTIFSRRLRAEGVRG